MRLVKYCVIAIAVLGATAGCAFAADVRSELRSIPVNSGGSVIDRIERCGIKVQWGVSWDDGKTLQIIADLPKMPGDRDRTPYTDIVFRWVKAGGKWKPDGAGWAHDLMFNPAPLGSSQWLNC